MGKECCTTSTRRASERRGHVPSSVPHGTGPTRAGPGNARARPPPSPSIGGHGGRWQRHSRPNRATRPPHDAGGRRRFGETDASPRPRMRIDEARAARRGEGPWRRRCALAEERRPDPGPRARCAERRGAGRAPGQGLGGGATRGDWPARGPARESQPIDVP
jgi:hypothetical protein